MFNMSIISDDIVWVRHIRYTLVMFEKMIIRNIFGLDFSAKGAVGWGQRVQAFEAPWSISGMHLQDHPSSPITSGLLTIIMFIPFPFVQTKKTPP